jgi:4-methyl-5(b-hydroxyethyl)-thiazole monophosphate biosynthesis
MANVLVLLPAGFEEVEAVTPVDLLRRAGHSVKLAALGDELTVKGRNGILLRADTLLGRVDPNAAYQLLLLPGGPGVAALRSSPDVREVLGRHVMADAWIAAICAAPLVLHDAGLLSGRHYTAHPSTATELTTIDASARVVVDGRIVTSRGAGTALDFGLKLVELLGFFLLHLFLFSH